MKIISALVLIAILIVGLGFYRGWFTLSRPAPATGSGTVNINLATDVDKMKQDAETVKDTVKDTATGLTGGVSDDIKADGQANDNVKSNEK